MATSYPGSLDSFTNPAGTDPRNSPSVAGSVSNLNDAVEALEAKLNTTANSGATGGLLFPSSGNLIQDATNLFWDNVAKALGLGTNSPEGRLHLAQATGELALVIQLAATSPQPPLEIRNSSGQVVASLDQNRLFELLTGSQTDVAVALGVLGNAFSSFSIGTDGELLWGTGTGAHDTSLFRSNPDELTTGSLVVTGDLEVQGNILISRAHFNVRRTSNQSIPNSTDTAMSWTQEDDDNDNMFTSGSIVTVNTPGNWSLSVCIPFAQNTTGARQVQITADGEFLAGENRSASSSGRSIMSAGWSGPLSTGDQLQVFVSQGSGGSLNVEPVGRAPFFSGFLTADV